MLNRGAPTEIVRAQRAVPYLDRTARPDFWNDPRCAFAFQLWTSSVDVWGLPRERFPGESHSDACARVANLRARYLTAAYGTADAERIAKMTTRKIEARYRFVRFA